jgi:hypothetical protein
MLQSKNGQTSLEFILLFAVAVSLVLLIGIVTLSAAQNVDVEEMNDEVAGTIEKIENQDSNRIKYLP